MLFVFYRVTRDIKIATVMLFAPRFTFLRPFFFFIAKTTDFTLVEGDIVFVKYLDHGQFYFSA